jgi:S1-C subfamily serine protease
MPHRKIYGRLIMSTLRTLALSTVAVVTLAAGTASAVAADLSVVDVVKATQSSIGRVTAVTPWLFKDGKAGRHTKVGTAFLIDQNGDMVTNCHVVHEDASDGEPSGPTIVSVQFPDRTDLFLPATVAGCDTLGDIAVLKVAGVGPWRTPLHFAAPKDVAVGEDVITIGFAQGLPGDPTVARGIVSALHRSVPNGDFSDLVQTDAAITQGNSGGPLLDLHGDVVGVNTYGTDFNMSYARSAASASRYAEAIIANGRVNRAALGINVKTMAVERVRLPRPGVLISAVDPHGPAGAVVSPDELVASVEWSNGFTYATADVGAWNDAMAMIRPGERVTLNVYRLTDAGVDIAMSLRDVPADAVFSSRVAVVAPAADPMRGIFATTLPQFPAHAIPRPLAPLPPASKT